MTSVNTFHVEDQADPAISQNGAAGNTIDVFEAFSQALDDYFLLTDQIVHQEAELLAFTFDNHQ